MKRFLLLFLTWITIPCRSAIVFWDGGGGDSSWNNAFNWSADILPGIADDVVMDNSLITGDYTVVLPGGRDSIIIRSLVISPSGGSRITLIISPSSIADTILYMTAPGYSLLLNNGAVLRNLSGPPPGASIVVADSFRINNGGHYIHNTTRANAGIVSRLSTGSGTESGIFEFDVPSVTGSYTVSLSDRTYGTLVFSSFASGDTVSYVGTGSNQLNILGDLRINKRTEWRNNLSSQVIVHGNYWQADSSVLDIRGSAATSLVTIKGNITCQGTIKRSGAGARVVELNGIINQDISIAGSISDSVALRINNTNGITLTQPLNISYQLQLVNGKIRTSATNILTLTDNASYTGGSASSFVEGPMRKMGDDDFDFPIGKGEIYAPIGISGTAANISDEFVAEYKRENPQTAPGLGNSLSPGIDHISYVEYWSLIASPGVSGTVKLTATAYSFARVLNNLLVARFGGGQWNNEGSSSFVAGPSSPPYSTGSFTSSGAVNTFGFFTIAAVDDEVVNPLPVQLIRFEARTINSLHTILHWELADGYHVDKFELERAGGDRRFERLTTMKGNAGGPFYSYEDEHLLRGINYYRLKITDVNGGTSYSRVVPVWNNAQGLYLVPISPQLVRSTIVIDVVSSIQQPASILLVDMEGRVRRKLEQQFMPGNNQVNLSADGLHRGVYMVLGISARGKTNLLRFIKE